MYMRIIMVKGVNTNTIFKKVPERQSTSWQGKNKGHGKSKIRADERMPQTGGDIWGLPKGFIFLYE